MARGNRQRREVQAVAPAQPVVTAALAALTDAPPPAAVVLPVVDTRSHADRNNPDKLTGTELRAFALQFGISRSEAASMNDDRLREQIRYAVYRRYSEE